MERTVTETYVPSVHSPHGSTVLRALGPVRAGVGVARLAFPDTVIPRLAPVPLPSRGRLVVRVLGARQIAQAMITSPNPTQAVLWLGAEVDVAHAASMIGLACIDRRYRRAALADAAIAAAFALVGIVAASMAPSVAPAHSRLTAWRNREAIRAARWLVPWYSTHRHHTEEKSVGALAAVPQFV